MKVTIFIPGQTASKKNSKQIVITGHRRRVISSDFYSSWEEAALLRLRQSELVGYPWNYPLKVGFHYVRKTKAAFDYNNLSQGPLDLLVQVGIIKKDDQYHIIPNGELSWEVNKDNPGVYVTLEEIEEVNNGTYRGTKAVLRAGTLQEEAASPHQGQGRQGAPALETHPEGDECLPVPLVRTGLVTGKPVQRP